VFRLYNSKVEAERKSNVNRSLTASGSPSMLSIWRTTIVAALVALTILAVVLALVGMIDPAWWQVIILGIVEGLTEFLPISSTAHLLVTAKLLDFQHSMGGTFEIFIQLGAVLAVVGYYARDLLGQVRAVGRSAETRRFWLAILIAFLPAAVVGLVLRDWIKAHLFASPVVIATAFIVGGIILILIERWPLRTVTHAAEETTLGQALVIGLAQVIALVPGASRSASSIVGGMLAGLDRRAATAFSFYLAIPTLGAATLVDLLGSLHGLSARDGAYLLVGLVVSFLTACLSIDWLLRYVAHHPFVAFGAYRIAFGSLILILVAIGWLI
jgi:undecaprenyl-diphosphatase